MVFWGRGYWSHDGFLNLEILLIYRGGILGPRLRQAQPARYLHQGGQLFALPPQHPGFLLLTLRGEKTSSQTTKLTGLCRTIRDLWLPVLLIILIYSCNTPNCEENRDIRGLVVCHSVTAIKKIYFKSWGKL